MKSTRPIILKGHLSGAMVSKALEEKGVQIVTVNNEMIANCKTSEEEALVNEINKTSSEQLWDDYFCSESVYD